MENSAKRKKVNIDVSPFLLREKHLFISQSQRGKVTFSSFHCPFFGWVVKPSWFMRPWKFKTLPFPRAREKSFDLCAQVKTLNLGQQKRRLIKYFIEFRVLALYNLMSRFTLVLICPLFLSISFHFPSFFTNLFFILFTFYTYLIFFIWIFLK